MPVRLSHHHTLSVIYETQSLDMYACQPLCYVHNKQVFDPKRVHPSCTRVQPPKGPQRYKFSQKISKNLWNSLKATLKVAAAATSDVKSEPSATSEKAEDILWNNLQTLQFLNITTHLHSSAVHIQLCTIMCSNAFEGSAIIPELLLYMVFSRIKDIFFLYWNSNIYLNS